MNSLLLHEPMQLGDGDSLSDVRIELSPDFDPKSIACVLYATGKGVRLRNVEIAGRGPLTGLRVNGATDLKAESLWIEGCEAQAQGRSVAEIEAKRNAVLVDMMHLFKKHKIGAGLVLAREEQRAKRAKHVKKR